MEDENVLRIRSSNDVIACIKWFRIVMDMREVGFTDVEILSALSVKAEVRQVIKWLTEES